MAEIHLDHPGDISWFAGQGPATVLGPCPHDCEHAIIPTIGWGPDLEHYCLVRCDDPAGCGGRCRGWTAERAPGHGPQLRVHGFKQVAP